ncbi:MAG: sporulation initiation factor Spo0A C-terminal domain-containing protein [Eubacteriales bacterium]
MSEQMKVLLVEDDLLVRSEYVESIRRHDSFVLVGQTGSEKEGLELYEKTKSNVIVLDLELEEGDGIHFMQKVIEQAKQKPYILVITNNRSGSVQQYMRENGADFICQKGNPSYTPEKALDIIKSTFPYHEKRQEEYDFVTYNQNKIRDYRRNAISDDLDGIGFKVTYNGTTFVLEAIYMKAFEFNSNESVLITKDIYPKIATMYHTNHKNVEKNIRDAIERTWKKAKPENIGKFYPFEVDEISGCPTNLEFITNMAKRYHRL